MGAAYSFVSKAMETALSNANQQDIIYVGGSTFVVAEII
jgi:dihydrofolate synthase/folylpolyglutamate synthase